MMFQSMYFVGSFVAVFLLTGCQVTPEGDALGFSKMPRLHFVPRDAITNSNLERLETVLLWQAGVPTAEERIITGPSKLIHDIAVCGDRQRLYFHPRQWSGKAKLQSVGIYEYDLRTGELVRKTRIPAYANREGEAIRTSNYSRTLFDFAEGKVYVSDTLDGGKPIGGAQAVVWRLDLTRDDPHILVVGPAFSRERRPVGHPELIRPQDVAKYPVIDVAGMMLWGGRSVYRAHAISVANLATEKIDGPYSMPMPDNHSWQVIGGSLDALLAEDRDTVELYVLKRDKDRMVIAERRGKSDLALNESNVLSRTQRRDLAKDVLSADEEVFLYGLPSMRVIGQLPRRATGSFIVIPNSHVLVTLPIEDHQAIRFFDLEKGVELLERRLAPPEFRNEQWTLICDETGLFIGACNRYRVQLFAIRPPERAKLSPTVDEANGPTRQD